MRDPFHSSVSAEKFAAYIDGSLPSSEMCRLSAKISGDKELQEQLAVCDDVDRAIEQGGDEGFALPEELCGDDFEIPTVPNRFGGVGYGGILAASVACAVAPKCAVDFNMDVACDGAEETFDGDADLFDDDEVSAAFDDDPDGDE